MNGTYRSSPIPLTDADGTVGAMLSERAVDWPDHPVLAHRQGGGYKTVCWHSFFKNIVAVADFLHRQGVRRGDRVAVLSLNSYVMLCWEMAVTSMGAVSVPIFFGYDSQHIDYILGHAEPTAILVDTPERLARLEACRYRREIDTIVTVQPSDYIRFEDCLNSRSSEVFFRMAKAVTPGDICFIQYTSGTTGDPKGVMLTHRNIISQRKALEKVWTIEHGARFLSYLPWHHSYGGLFERLSALYHGAAIYLDDSSGKDIDRLIANWRLVKPTHFFSVPKIYMALVTEAKLNEAIKKVLFHPELRFLFTAAAPLPRNCGEYFSAQHVPILEGWGLTETSPTVTITHPLKERIHSYVGEPIPGCEILITGENEILVRGPNIMKGYHKDPARTAEAIDRFGWLHTGDLGELTDCGLKLRYRRDGLFKLANGEKVSSVLVENALTDSSGLIKQAVVVGSGENFVAALIFPDMRRLGERTGKTGTRCDRGWELSRDRRIQEMFRLEIEENTGELEPAYLKVKAFVIIPEELTIGNGCLTPSLKVVRHQVARKYKDWIHAFYRPAQHPERLAYIVGGGRDDYYWKKN